MNPENTIHPEEKFAARVFLILNCLFLLFIMFASWSDGDFHGLRGIHFAPVPSWRRLISYHNLRDTVTNILLYIPLGVFTGLTISVKKARLFSPWIFFGTLVSFCMESVQSLISRHADPLDLVTNSFGYVVGFSVAVIALRFFGLKPATLLGLTMSNQSKSQINTISALRFMYIALYVIVALIPFDVCVHMTQIYGKLHPDTFGRLRIILDPLYHFKTWPANSFDLLFNFLGLLPISILTALLDGLKKRFHPASPVAITFFTSLILEITQIFFYSKTSDIMTVFLAFLAGWIGWGVVFWWFKLQELYGFSSYRNIQTGFKWISIFLSSYLIFIFLSAWYPFQFEERFDKILLKLNTETNWIPFQSHFHVRNIFSALDLVKEIGVFIPLGILIGFLFEVHWRVKSKIKVLWGTFFICIMLACFVELSQVICRERWIDTTDVLLNGLGGVLGVIFLKLFRKNSPL